jgi:hypothetical protein
VKKIIQIQTPSAGVIVALDGDGGLWQREADNNKFGPRGTTVYRWVKIPGPDEQFDVAVEAQVEAFRAALLAAKAGAP